MSSKLLSLKSHELIAQVRQSKNKQTIIKAYEQLERLSSHPTSSQQSPPGQPQLHRCKPSLLELASLNSMQPMTHNISQLKKQTSLWHWQYWHSRVVHVNLWTRQLSSSDGYLRDKYWAFLKPACSELVGKRQIKKIKPRWEDEQTEMLTTDSENTKLGSWSELQINLHRIVFVTRPNGFSSGIISAMLASSS